MWPRKKAPASDALTAAVLARADKMRAHLDSVDSVYRQNEFWSDIGAQNRTMLESGGVEHFKRSVSQNYFNWAVEGAADPKFRKLLLEWSENGGASPLEAELIGDPRITSLNGTKFIQSDAAARGYTLYVGLLWWWASRNHPHRAIRLVEPAVGDPVPIQLGGRLISQDLANSLREFSRFAPHFEPRTPGAKPVLAELGAGYGRLGYASLRLMPARYWVFDVAPALAISEWYLAEVLRDATVFRWRPFQHWSEVADEVAAADVCFFSPDQLQLAPDDAISVFAAVSALHEMTSAQIGNYLNLMGAKSAAIYVKNWTAWRNEADGVDFTSDMLAPPDGWTVAWSEVDDVISSFTEKLFVRGSKN